MVMVTSEVIASIYATLGVFIVFFILLITAILVFSIVCNWKMFVKAEKPGWASIIPVYNMIVMLDIIGYKWYYIFFFLLGGIPCVGQIALIIFMISLNIKLAKSFKQSTAFGIGLWIINIVFVAIIAFSNEIEYDGPVVDGDIDFNDLF